MKSLLVISIAQPLLVGIYEDKQLVKVIQEEGKTSDILPLMIQNILKEETIDELIYVNGPGSYMAIKIAYIFLKTISITKNIPLYALEGFSLNNNSPIKALGKKYFIKKDNEIVMDIIKEDTLLEDFTLPNNLQDLIFSDDTLPEYHLPAVI